MSDDTRILVGVAAAASFLTSVVFLVTAGLVGTWLALIVAGLATVASGVAVVVAVRSHLSQQTPPPAVEQVVIGDTAWDFSDFTRPDPHL